MEGIPKLHRLSCTQNSLLTGKCPFRTHSNPHKHFCHAVTGIKIVIYNQTIPESRTLQRAGAAGTALPQDCPAAIAGHALAGRILGERIPLTCF